MRNDRIFSSNGYHSIAQAKGRDPAPIEMKPARPAASGQDMRYLAVSPNGSCVEIPKELFIALSDFLETRKYPGSISIQFRRGEIICVEAAAKKRYR
jgi:hypothetical protein